MRKVLISLLLAAVLLCSGVTASAVTVQVFPKRLSVSPMW